jgi:hypothetical protein
MQSTSIFRIKKRKMLLFWMWWYMLIAPILIYWLPLPRMLLYLGDALGFLFFLIELRDRIVLKRPTYICGTTKGLIAIFLVMGTLSAVINNVAPICYLWGIRNCGLYGNA